MPTKYTGLTRPEDANSDLSGGVAAIMRVLRRLGHPTPVEVIAVHSDGVSPTGTVDVRPLVPMQDGAAVTYPHETIYDVPYIRIQGGVRAFICDPVAGDNGIILVCGRDISGVKANRGSAAPASFRTFDFADAVYFGGLLDVTPTEYVAFIDGGVEVQTAGNFVVRAAAAQFQCGITATGDVVGNGISLDNHVHPDPQGGTTGKPQ